MTVTATKFLPEALGIARIFASNLRPKKIAHQVGDCSSVALVAIAHGVTIDSLIGVNSDERIMPFSRAARRHVLGSKARACIDFDESDR